ncbi:uncharacterized protein MEPE_06130 [Melanopsichium pennsylvanicum]|uniref:Uncharacterized protein n=2 Tax=Melanopsichium pennsylvanicum TaxID=63383 RepID=A0AAJ5C7Y4_9BASI|nr:hypothetical protein BN887_01878 [Melanopsichium pennsylvanicum 4]SNX87420.1 uncharacterized protein MEPE_06130 [Melanopsichium pennsylvanicum]
MTSSTPQMKPEPATAAVAAHDSKPSVFVLKDGNHGLQDWLTAHSASRLNVPAAFNNDVPPQPIWVITLPSASQIAEFDPDITTDKTFIKATSLANEATTQIANIQASPHIPTHTTKAVKSKKQHRTQVLEELHQHMMLLGSEHPLWDQGKWTMLIRPQQIHKTFSELAHSLATGALKEQGSIIALRARTLPLSESTFEMNNKRKKTSHPTKRSPTSARHDNEISLGIDIFFGPVWSSSVARDVLRVVAESSGRMASFCKASLYSKLGIKYGHHLGAHASLYNSKKLANPADTKNWTAKYHQAGSITMLGDVSSDDSAGSSGKPTTSPKFLPSKPEREKAKRHLENDVPSDTTNQQETPAQKKPRNGEEPSLEQQPTVLEPAAPFQLAQEAQSQVDESQDEPMLPVRHHAKIVDVPLILIAEKPHRQTNPFAQKMTMDDTCKAGELPAVTEPDIAEATMEESQTQIEPVVAIERTAAMHNTKPAAATTATATVAVVEPTVSGEPNVTEGERVAEKEGEDAGTTNAANICAASGWSEEKSKAMHEQMKMLEQKTCLTTEEQEAMEKVDHSLREDLLARIVSSAEYFVSLLHTMKNVKEKCDIVFEEMKDLDKAYAGSPQDREAKKCAFQEEGTAFTKQMIEIGEEAVAVYKVARPLLREYMAMEDKIDVKSQEIEEKIKVIDEERQAIQTILRQHMAEHSRSETEDEDKASLSTDQKAVHQSEASASSEGDERISAVPESSSKSQIVDELFAGSSPKLVKGAKAEPEAAAEAKQSDSSTNAPAITTTHSPTEGLPSTVAEDNSLDKRKGAENSEEGTVAQTLVAASKQKGLSAEDTKDILHDLSPNKATRQEPTPGKGKGREGEAGSKVDSTAERSSVQSGEVKECTGPIVLERDTFDSMLTAGSDEDEAETEVPAAHTAHSVETVEMVSPAAVERLLDSGASTHEECSGAEIRNTIDEAEAQHEAPSKLSITHEESSMEQPKFPTEAAQKADPPHLSHDDMAAPIASADTSPARLTEPASKPEEASIGISDESLEDARPSIPDKPESQASAPEMSLDELIVEGVTSSPTFGQTVVEEPTTHSDHRTLPERYRSPVL